MVAYSFQRRFEAPIHARTKRQTIRADRRRHSRQGEELQLYTGMRTRSCRLIARAPCLDVQPIRLTLHPAGEVDYAGERLAGAPNLDRFARLDGFENWADMVAFWREQHPDVSLFSGWCISWGDLLPDAQP